MTARVSAAVIAFNEEDKIGDCLKSLSWVDEIVVVDSHSTDRTREIAASFGAKVIERDWPGNIKQKNFALENCSNEWVISLDADERISKALKGEIQNALRDPSADGYQMPRRVFYINRWITRCGWYPAPKVRLVKKELAKWGGVDPHDTLFVKGKIGKFRGDIYHLSFDSIFDHFNTINNFTRIGAIEGHKRGKRAGVIDITVRPLFTFIKMYIFKLGFLDGMPGYIASSLSAYHTFTKYDRLYNIQESE